ncbi:MAG: hypothetical protein GYA21_19530 [Myxococcales bacterium]|nr:hypothetical protein [Myxococcales bacterium]
MRACWAMFAGVWALASTAASTAQEKKLPKQPVEIRAERLRVEQKERRAVFEEAVEARQGTLTVRCRRLEVSYAGEKDRRARAGEILLMQFSGEVEIEQGERRGHCQQASYDRPAGILVCTGDPWVTEGPNRIAGERIEYLLEAGEVRVQRPRAVIRVEDTAPSHPEGKRP